MTCAVAGGDVEVPVPVPLSLMTCVEPGAFKVLSPTVSVPLT